MNKSILLALILSFPAFGQNLDDLTLESKTAPTVMEDGTDLSQAPMEEPVMESTDSPDVTDNANPSMDIPAQLPDASPMDLTNNSNEEKTLTETPAETIEAPAEVPEEVATPNPTIDESRPQEAPETIVDKTPPPSVSTPVITTEAPADDRYIKHRKSHWVTSFAFEGLKYELPFEFTGERQNFKNRDQELWGARVGAGGQLYLGGGFFTTSMVEAYYLGTFTRRVQVADPEVDDEEAGSVKRAGSLWGGDISQNLGYIFEFRTKNPIMDEWAYLTFEPFVEAGIGIARAYNSILYKYDTGTGANGVQEQYKKKMSDELTNARVGAGFNLTGRSGFFMTAKVSVNRYDILKRKSNSYARQDDGTITNNPTETEKDVKLDPITVFTIGGGYKF